MSCGATPNCNNNNDDDDEDEEVNWYPVKFKGLLRPGRRGQGGEGVPME